MESGGRSAAVFISKVQDVRHNWLSMKIIDYVSRVLRLLLFLLLLAFAAKNTEPVPLHFFLGQTWQLPLSLLLFIFFAFGAIIALLACVGRFYRDKREIRALKLKLPGTADASQPAPDEKAPATPPRDAVI